MRLQVLEVTRLRKGQAGARTSRKEKGKGYAAGFRGCVVRRFGLHVFLYSAQSGQYVEDHASETQNHIKFMQTGAQGIRRQAFDIHHPRGRGIQAALSR